MLFEKFLIPQNRCGASYGGGAVCAYGDSELRVEIVLLWKMKGQRVAP